MKKSIFCIFMVVCMMVSMLAMTIPTAAEAVAESKNYIWDFETAELNDGVIATTGDDANKMVWNEKTGYEIPMTRGLDGYGPFLEDNTKRYAISIGKYKQASILENPDIFEEVTVSTRILDGKFSAIGGYFTLENAITLKADKPWRIELSGLIANGVDVFWGPNGEVINFGTSSMTIKSSSQKSMNTNAAWLNGESEYNFSNVLDVTGQVVGGRIGQANVQQVAIYNEYDEVAGKWYIWFEMSAGARGAGVYKFKDISTDEFGEMVITSFGSEAKPFALNLNWSDVRLMPYLDYIKVYEDISKITVIESVETGIIPEPVLGATFRKISNIDDATVNYTLGKVKWTDAAGESANKVETGTYTATITLTPNTSYAFDANATVVPDEYTTKIFNEDGTLTLTKTFTFEEDTTPAVGGDDDVTPPADGGDDVTTPADGGDDVTPPADDKKDGCKGTVVSGAIVVALACAAGFAFKKKED